MAPAVTTRLILETARIEEVVQDFLALNRSGLNFTTLCPLHHEKTPSFKVCPSRNIFKCSGCGKGGNAARFLMEHEGFSYPEALRWLAKKYGIKIQGVQPPPEQLAAQQEGEGLFILNGFAQTFFQDNLPGLGSDYFMGRGYSSATIQKFGLGYAPDNWDALTKTAIRAGFKLEHLQKLGLSSQSDKDFFRNRAIFPIHDLSGKPIAFAGRILSSKEDGTDCPKYLNSPESDLYQKSKTLYGIHFARKAIRQNDECILVEGYTDLISLHQTGMENVVASAGTALTAEQLLLVRRFSKNLKILFDGDPAGIKAALKGLDLALGLGMDVKIVPLPHPDDPDSFLQKIGAEAFSRFIKNEEKGFIQFKAKVLLDAAKNEPVKQAAAVHGIVGSIAHIPDPVKRSFFIKECAIIAGISKDILQQETNRAIQKQPKKKATFKLPENVTNQHSSKPEDTERNMTFLLLEHGAEVFDEKEKTTVASYMLGNIGDVQRLFTDPLCQRIWQESLALVADGQPVSMQHFIAHENLSVSSFAAELASCSLEFEGNTQSKQWQEMGFRDTEKINSIQTFKYALLRFKLEAINRQSKTNRLRLDEAQRTGNTEKVLALLKAQSSLDEARNNLTVELQAC